MRLPAPRTLFGQGPWKPQGITFSDVFDAEGTATITCSFITSTRWSARSSPGARGQMGAVSPVRGILENLEKATKATEIMVKDLEKMKHMKGSWQ